MRNKSEEHSVKLVLDTLRYFYSIILKYKPSYFILCVCDITVNSVSPFINIVMPKYIIDQLVGEKNIKKIALYVAITVLGNVVFNLLKNIVSLTRRKYGDDFDRYFSIGISEKTMSMDFEYTENPEVLNQSEKAKTGMQWYSGGVEGITSSFLGIISSSFTLLGVVYILVTKAYWLLLIISITIIFDTIFNAKINAISVKYFKLLSALNRGFGYVYWELSDFRYGKDIRLYGADKMMLQKADSFNEESTNNWRKQSEESLKYTQGSSILNGMRDGITYFYLGFITIKKIISIGDFMMLSSSAGTFSSSLQSVIFNVQEIYKKCSYAYEYVKFMEYPSKLINGKEKLKATNKHTFEFKSVSFKYPGSDIYVLKNISIKIEPGEHLSVVGLNGAGKTTFIKLLCRFYQVSGGEILLDGININEYDYGEYTKVLSAVFQDFKLVSFSIKDNIALGEEDTPKVLELIDFIGLSEKIANLPSGVDTSIYKQFDEDGIEPSGGEQQKIAIVRALYKDAPVVILDEPTAALDPVAEYEIYRQFDKLVGGKTAVYISHRLSSCKFCDKIAVFSEGTIAEYGTHDELLSIEGGIYSAMFKAQAQYYVE